MSNPFPSMKGSQLLALLKKAPLSYVVKRQKGSHRIMESPDYPRITVAFHETATVGGGAVKRILTSDVGLKDDEALDLCS